MKILGIIIIGIGLVLAYLLFFVLAPYVCSLIPNSDWKKFLDFLVYAIIGFGGGIGIVISFIGFGSGIIITGE